MHTAEIQSRSTLHFFTWAGWRQQLFIYCNPYSKSLWQRLLLQNRNSLPYTKKQLILYWEKKSIKLPKKMRSKILSTCSISQLQWKGFLARAEWIGPRSFRYELPYGELPICEVFRASSTSTFRFQPISFQIFHSVLARTSWYPLEYLRKLVT